MLPPLTLGSTALLRLERASLLARYDNGALSAAVFAVLKKLEIEIAWRQHAKLLRTEEGRAMTFIYDCSRDGARCVYGYFSLINRNPTERQTQCTSINSTPANSSAARILTASPCASLSKASRAKTSAASKKSCWRSRTARRR